MDEGNLLRTSPAMSTAQHFGKSPHSQTPRHLLRKHQKPHLHLHLRRRRRRRGQLLLRLPLYPRKTYQTISCPSTRAASDAYGVRSTPRKPTTSNASRNRQGRRSSVTTWQSTREGNSRSIPGRLTRTRPQRVLLLVLRRRRRQRLERIRSSPNCAAKRRKKSPCRPACPPPVKAATAAPRYDRVRTSTNSTGYGNDKLLARPRTTAAPHPRRPSTAARRSPARRQKLRLRISPSTEHS